MAGKRYTFVLNFGYVESSDLSYMPWVSTDTYKDAKEALVDLATFFKDQFILQNSPAPRKCCGATKTKDAAAVFCTKCGRPIGSIDFDAGVFMDWLRELSSSDTDGLGKFIYDAEYNRWQAGLLEGSPNQRFVYQAEWILAAAIGHPLRPDITFEKICGARTKGKKDSFNYY